MPFLSLSLSPAWLQPSWPPLAPNPSLPIPIPISGRLLPISISDRRLPRPAFQLPPSPSQALTTALPVSSSSHRPCPIPSSDWLEAERGGDEAAGKGGPAARSSSGARRRQVVRGRGLHPEPPRGKSGSASPTAAVAGASTQTAEGGVGQHVVLQVHDGGKMCVFDGCSKVAEGSTPPCKAHGGGKRCMFEGGGVCPKSVHRGTNYCVAHGEGKRCSVPGCAKSARGGTDFCVKHGRGKRCRVDSCGKSAQGSTEFCKAHGGGKRCTFGTGCEKFARGRSGLCAVHATLVASQSGAERECRSREGRQGHYGHSFEKN